jgi:hypothetical protein
MARLDSYGGEAETASRAPSPAHMGAPERRFGTAESGSDRVGGGAHIGSGSLGFAARSTSLAGGGDGCLAPQWARLPLPSIWHGCGAFASVWLSGPGHAAPASLLSGCPSKHSSMPRRRRHSLACGWGGQIQTGPSWRGLPPLRPGYRPVAPDWRFRVWAICRWAR